MVTQTSNLPASARDMLEKLERDGVVTLDSSGAHTTRRWQSALMRAIARNMRANGDEVDVRSVITDALLELYGRSIDEDTLVAAVEAMTHVELELLRITNGGERHVDRDH
jgi:hypothetical protein